MGSRVWDDPGSRSQDTLHDVIYRCGNVRVLGCGMHWSTIGLPGDPPGSTTAITSVAAVGHIIMPVVVAIDCYHPS